MKAFNKRLTLWEIYPGINKYGWLVVPKTVS